MLSTKNSLPLITIDEDTHQFQITQQAITYLSSLEKPIAIITIAGLYRTGKSFLVNRLIRSRDKQETEGFKVGSTTKSVTKGLNVWGSPITIQNERGEDIDYLLIDSEGIGSCEQQSKYDTNLLILIFLISSTIIYNTLNAIDEMGLQQLEVVLKLKKCLQNHELLNPSPKFIWVLRDFSLQLIDQLGNQMNPNQYLQKCLECTTAKTAQTRRKNQIRQAIKQNLVNRTCYTLVRPTNRQEDLNNLNSFSKNNGGNPKLRTEFLGQIQELRQEIFSGASSDIKIINGQKLTGRTLLKLIKEYVDIINHDEIPNVSDVWDSIVKNTNAQLFEEGIKKLKQEYKKINLPLGKDQLKIRLNQIGNRIYNEFEKKLTSTCTTQDSEESVYKKFHKEFIKVIQKLAIQIKSKNQELKNTSTLVQLREFVKQNVQFDKISPLNVASVLKNLIERMKLKTNGYGEGYEYLLGVISDVLFIVQQKANRSERELSEYKLILQKQQSQKKHQDLVLINMKKQYHQALKTIAKLQEGQAQIDKNHSLLKNRAKEFQKKCIELDDQNKQLKLENERIFKELDEKLRKRVEELSQTIRNLREENKKYLQEIYQLKTVNEKNQIKERKQIIFEEKIQASYEKFEKERKQLIQKISVLREQSRSQTAKYQQLMGNYLEQCAKNEEMQSILKKKEDNFHKQLQNLRACMKETKNSYQLTCKTKQQSDRVFRDIQNLTSAKKNRQGESNIKDEINDEKQRQIMKNYYENQLTKQKQAFEEESEQLVSRIQEYTKKIEEEGIQKKIYFEENKELKQKIMKLEREISEANKKFTSCLKQLEQARESERSLYEDSIVRLLNNIEKRALNPHSIKRQDLIYSKK